jgi:hypothetical protein
MSIRSSHTYGRAHTQLNATHSHGLKESIHSDRSFTVTDWEREREYSFWPLFHRNGLRERERVFILTALAALELSSFCLQPVQKVAVIELLLGQICYRRMREINWAPRELSVNLWMDWRYKGYLPWPWVDSQPTVSWQSAYRESTISLT